VSGAQC